MEHPFPGNVRELENIIEHAFVLCRSGVIELKRLPPDLRGNRLGEAMTLRAMEKLLVTDALRRHGGSRKLAARELGINASMLFRKLKEFIQTTAARAGKTCPWLGRAPAASGPPLQVKAVRCGGQNASHPPSRRCILRFIVGRVALRDRQNPRKSGHFTQTAVPEQSGIEIALPVAW
jgi:DNA-binding protein Fis